MQNLENVSKWKMFKIMKKLYNFFTLTVEISDPCPLLDQTEPRHCQGTTFWKRLLSITKSEFAISDVVNRFRKISAAFPFIDVRSISSFIKGLSEISSVFIDFSFSYFRISLASLSIFFVACSSWYATGRFRLQN